MTTHAKLSPSGAKRWMTCPGSINLVEKLNIKDVTSKYAAEGTVAHGIGEKCLTTVNEPENFLGANRRADGFTFKVNEDMTDAVEVYVDYIQDNIEQVDVYGDAHMSLQVEVKCSLKSLGIPGMDGGTSDALLICLDHRFIEVIDYKHGQGVAVDVDDNPQLMSYGIGALIKVCKETKTAPFEWTINLTIVQPRAHHPDGRIRSTSMTGDELMDWAEWDLVPAAEATMEEDAELVPSDDGCRFCPAAGQCPALYAKTQEIAIADFKDDSFPNPIAMTTEQKQTVMDHAIMLRSFITAVENQIKLEMDHGSDEYEDCYKLVRKTTHRKFTGDALDPDFSDLLDHLELNQIFIEKPRAMGEIEKALKKVAGKKQAEKIMKTLTIKPEGDTVVALISDKRKAITASAISDFEDLVD